MFVLKSKTKNGGNAVAAQKAVMMLGYFATLRVVFVAFQYFDVQNLLK